MKKKNFVFGTLCVVLAVTCLHISVLGQSAEEGNKLAAISGSGSSVRWDVAVPYSMLTMTVSGPDGRVFRKEFKAGTSPEFAIIDQNGERLPDGQYTYELRLTPIFSPGVREELAAARASEYAEGPDKEKSKQSATSESLLQKFDSEDTVRDLRKRGLLPSEPLVKSGAFAILNGSLIVAGAVEEAAPRPTREADPRPTKKVMEVSQLPTVPLPTVPRPTVPPGGAVGKVRQHHLLLNPDQVIPDDLIVQSSVCVGFDCVNGESFGFDTIRLKENNTRISFNDTSVGAFPTNDWTIRANSSTAGGASFLAFVDRGVSNAGDETGTIVFEVDAGAPANSIKVDSSGRVGLRTGSPVLDMHINTSNTPAIRLEQNSSGGFSAQTWDIAGNEANFFVRDVTGGSRLPLRIRPGAPTSSIDINNVGNVGIGTASPQYKTQILGANANPSLSALGGIVAVDGGSGTNQLTIGAYSASPFGVWFQAKDNVAGVGSGNSYPILLNPLGGNVGIGTTAPTLKLSVNGDANKSVGGGSWQVFSDERLKTIKGRFNSGLKAVMQLQPIRYQYRKDNALSLKSEGENIGFGAQTLQKIVPEAVTRNENGYLQVSNDPIIWTMLNAIKEQQKEIELLKREVRQLRASRKRR